MDNKLYSKLCAEKSCTKEVIGDFESELFRTKKMPPQKVSAIISELKKAAEQAYNKENIEEFARIREKVREKRGEYSEFIRK